VHSSLSNETKGTPSIDFFIMVIIIYDRGAGDLFTRSDAIRVSS